MRLLFIFLVQAAFEGVFLNPPRVGDIFQDPTLLMKEGHFKGRRLFLGSRGLRPFFTNPLKLRSPIYTNLSPHTKALPLMCSSSFPRYTRGPLRVSFALCPPQLGEGIPPWKTCYPPSRNSVRGILSLSFLQFPPPPFTPVALSRRITGPRTPATIDLSSPPGEHPV